MSKRWPRDPRSGGSRMNLDSDADDDTTESGENQETPNRRNRQDIDRVSPNGTPLRRSRSMQRRIRMRRGPPPPGVREEWESAEEEVTNVLQNQADRLAGLVRHAHQEQNVARQAERAARQRQAAANVAAALARDVAAPERDVATLRRNTDAPQRGVTAPARGVTTPRREIAAPEEETTPSEEESEILAPREPASPQNAHSNRRVISPAGQVQTHSQSLSQSEDDEETATDDDTPWSRSAFRQRAKRDRDRAASNQGGPNHSDLMANRNSEFVEAAVDTPVAGENEEQADEFFYEAAASGTSTFNNTLPPRPTWQQQSLEARDGEVTEGQDERVVQPLVGAGIDQSVWGQGRISLRQSLAPFAKRKRNSE